MIASLAKSPSISISVPAANSISLSTPPSEQEAHGPSDKISTNYTPVVVPVAIHPTHIPHAPPIHVAPAQARTKTEKGFEG